VVRRSGATVEGDLWPPRALTTGRQPGSSAGVLAVTLGVLHAVAEGVPAEDAVCTSLAHEVDAVVAAYIALDPGTGTATVVAWPHSLDLVPLQVLLDEPSAGLPHLLRRLTEDRRARCLSAGAASLGWPGTFAGLLLEAPGCRDVAQVPLDVPGPGVRLVVLGSGHRFGSGTVHLLERLRTPLTDVLRIAGERTAPTEPDPAAVPWPGLTERETEVLRLMAEGLLARTIAAQLAVSPRTVHKHLGNIYRKLDAHDRLVAVRRAEAIGLLDPAPLTPTRWCRAACWSRPASPG
jgi:DNA-binding CsgD family transcriptional regulator